MGRKKVIPERIYNFINYDDVIEKDGGRLWYRASCPKCGSDRGYKRPNKFNQICIACQTINMRSGITEDSRKKHSESMRGKTPWNKDKTKETDERVQQVANAQLGRKCNHEVKIRISCTQRQIDIKEFTGFTRTESGKERSKMSDIRQDFLRKSNFTCDKCSQRGTRLNVHHLNSWHSYIEQRFEMDNLVCLCETCHKAFHKQYGKKHNSKIQYIEFKNKG